MFLMLSLPGIQSVFGQDQKDYDEIAVLFTVQQVGGIEIPAVIRGTAVFLPITDIFNFLKIRNTASPDFDSITGFFLNPQNPYSIERKANRILFASKTFTLQPDDFVLTETNLYLRDKYFGDIFGLECRFNFRGLSVNVTTKVELPVIRELRLEAMRQNISRLKGETKADTTLKRTYPVFHFGNADWSVISTQQVNGACDNRFNLGLGAVLFGGETDIALNYSTREPFTERQQYYLWKYANNDHKIVRQIMAGKIITQATSSIYAPIVGAQITNAPTTYRRSFGFYTLSDYTEPGWMVELYVNNVLVDYLKADASGFFTFQVPLVYGNSNVKLRFYGPWGEERSREQNISIPFTFLPPGELEYTVSAGMVEDTLSSRFSRGSVNYGISRRVTVGGGVEYLSSVTSGPVMPFVNLSLRIATGFLVSAEYTHGVRFKGIINYRLPSNLQFDILYTRFHRNQTAINFNILEERKAVISIPFSGKKISSFVRFTLDQIILPTTQSTTAELLLSGSLFGVNANLTTYSLFAEQNTPYVYSNISLGFRLPGGFILTPQAQYEYNHNDFISAKCEIEKRIFRNGYANLSYERNFKSNISNAQVGLRYDFSFAQTAFTFRQTNSRSNLIETARGSMIYDRKTGYLVLNNRTSVGRGGLTILSFLDMNCNGKRDPGEPKIPGLSIRLIGGRVEMSAKDTLLRVFDLEPYVSYFLELDKNSFENISWRLPLNTLRVYVDPNQMKLIEIPVFVYGEASGYVYLKNRSGQKGQGRVFVSFFSAQDKLIAKTLTESDGYFSFLGLPPGSFYACVDSSQLSNLNMVSAPDKIPFTLQRTSEGDVVDGLEFILESLEKGADIDIIQQPKEEPVREKETEKAKETGVEKVKEIQKNKESIKVNEEKTAPVMIKGQKVIQVASYKVRSNADAVVAILEKSFPGMVHADVENGFFKVRIDITGDAAEVARKLSMVKQMGYPDAFILPSR